MNLWMILAIVELGVLVVAGQATVFFIWDVLRTPASRLPEHPQLNWPTTSAAPTTIEGVAALVQHLCNMNALYESEFNKETLVVAMADIALMLRKLAVSQKDAPAAALTQLG
jgi:hypothetical protein